MSKHYSKSSRHSRPVGDGRALRVTPIRKSEIDMALLARALVAAAEAQAREREERRD